MFNKSEIAKFSIVGGVIIILLVLYFGLTSFRSSQMIQIDSFEDCVVAGNPVMESYPRQCRTEDGRLFVEEIDEPIQVPAEDNDDRENPRDNNVEDGEGSSGNVGNISRGECRRTGCSSQICSDREVVTTCEYRPEYSCYESATCERQPDGECGWTFGAEAKRCFDDIKIPPSTI